MGCQSLVETLLILKFAEVLLVWLQFLLLPLFEGLQVRRVCLDDILTTVEVLVVFTGLFHGRGKLSIHLLLLVHASVLWNILEF